MESAASSAYKPSGVDLNFASSTEFVNTNNKRVRFAQSATSNTAPVVAPASSFVETQPIDFMEEDITPPQQVSRLDQMETITIQPSVFSSNSPKN